MYCVLSCPVDDSLQPPGLQFPRFLCPWNFPSKNSGVGSHFFLQGIFPTQGSNLHLLHWQVYLLPLGYLGSQNTLSYIVIKVTITRDCLILNFLPTNLQLCHLMVINVIIACSALDKNSNFLPCPGGQFQSLPSSFGGTEAQSFRDSI